jgi:hypothetical protein
VPFTDVGATLAWNRLLDPRMTWTTSVTFDWLDANDIGSSQRLFWQIMTGVKSQLTRQLTVLANVGVGFANAWQNNPVPLGTPTFIQSGAANSVIASAIVNYQLLRTTALTVSAAHLIAPTSFGQLQEITTAGFTVSHDINFWSNVTLGAYYAHTDSGTNNLIAAGGADFFSAQVAYSYRLSRDWRTRVSYTFRERHDNTGTATSNTGLLSIVYDFNLMGNPAALDPVEVQRRLIRQQTAIGQVFPTFQ